MYLRKLQKTMFWIFGIPLVFVFLIFTFFYFHQEKILFFPELLEKNYRFNFPDAKEADLGLENGRSVNYLVFNSQSTLGSILYFHGNAGSLKSWGFVAQEIAQKTGFSVWIVDYPGYGKSDGPLPKTEKILFEVSDKLLNAVVIANPLIPIIAFGRSVGCGIASHLALNSQVSALVLETPYRSLAKLGHELYPFLPEFFSRFDLDVEKDLENTFSKQILVIHGTRDEVIPFHHGKFVGEKFSNTLFIPVEGGGHNNLSEFPEYWPALTKFVSSLGKK